MTWSASQYLKFEDERTRPARDLLAQVPPPPPGSRLYDLGCGPGNSTALIAARFPDAPTIGIDSDARMLEAARLRLPALTFQAADLAAWKPDAPAGLLFANAVFQWIPDHLAVLDRLMDGLLPGGTLAVQMPDTIHEPTHRAMDDVAGDPHFIAQYRDSKPGRSPLPAPATYVETLRRKAGRVDVWHTVYYHPLRDPQAIVEWMEGTGLRPYLDPLPEAGRAAFLDAYRERIAAAYPPMADGRVLLRFPRLFLIAHKAP